jgi:type I restriction enzyme S subunit
MNMGWHERRIGEILQLEYGKPLDDLDRKPTGRFPVYGANGEKHRTDKFYHAKASIIVGRKGSAGEINLTEGKFWPLDVTYFVTFDERQHDLRFLYYLLMTLELTKLAKGVKPGINRNDVYSKVARVPPLPEQHRIVAILDEAFEGIATAKANAEKNLQNARAIFESQLQFVFTERAKTWKRKTLEEIATTFGRGKSKHRPRNAPHLYGGDYPFVQTGDIRNADHIITEYSQTYSEAGLAQSKLWPKGTICITIAANIAETAILGFDACFPDSVIGVVANPKDADVGFIEYLLQSFKGRIQAMGKGSAQANINMGTFENERFPFPSVTEQQSIVTELDGLNRTTQRLTAIYTRKLAALEDLKKSLLHRAFAGELTADKTSELIEAVA